MADKNGRAVILDPRRNQTIERKKLFEEMLLKEMPGIFNGSQGHALRICCVLLNICVYVYPFFMQLVISDKLMIHYLRPTFFPRLSF